VVTLDCTLSEPLATLDPSRHLFYPLCLGSEQQSQVNPAFISLPHLMQKIGRPRADILKVRRTVSCLAVLLHRVSCQAMSPLGEPCPLGAHQGRAMMAGRMLALPRVCCHRTALPPGVQAAVLIRCMRLPARRWTLKVGGGRACPPPSAFAFARLVLGVQLPRYRAIHRYLVALFRGRARTARV
jgi:hypothetical protein